MNNLIIFLFFLLGINYGHSQTLVKGIILNTTSEPISGAVITEKETTNNTVSDKDGRFTIAITNLVENKYLLSISQEGYLYCELSGFGYETKPIIEMIRTDENFDGNWEKVPKEKEEKQLK